MNELKASYFPAFFEALYGYKPFPWQRMLVEQIAANTWPVTGWPEGIDLPTASGKTACIDAAVFLLALFEQDSRLSMDSPARRRIFFVVDRRIVVDEAFSRAERLAARLKDASDGIVKAVADRLRALAGDESPEPLVVSRLRGGTVKDEQWRLSPAQPAIITSTVDQVGSRLLFRSYGASNLSAPIEAALTANDSLILLDEAHCAQPFMQTARAVRRYAGPDWMETDPLVPPLTFSVLSATLPDEVTDVFPGEREREAALNHPLLHERREASKPATLIQVGDTGDNDEKLIGKAIDLACAYVKDNSHQRIAIMVNRVARAATIHEQLKAMTAGDKPKLDADVVLMTGRMRPIDRDALVEELSPHLRAGADEQPERPIILVTTQCLEVGADFSFDALITECASLDALRQRFGRLNRLGELTAIDAAVLVRKGDIGANSDDPIYRTALKDTWRWLCEPADVQEQKVGRKTIEQHEFDFGIQSVDAVLPDDAPERETLLKRLSAPSPDAPVMLPAHVDLLCQTAPRPTPDPDVAIFLHGPQRHVPEARVVFRADLVETTEQHWRQKWRDAVALLPPLTAEALTLPLWLIRQWLTNQEPNVADLSDVESQQHADTSPDAVAGQPFVIWRGQRETVVSRSPQDVRPNETIVVPASEQLAEQLGHVFCRPEDTPLDVAEQAYPMGRNQAILRLLPAVFSQPGVPTGLVDIEPIKELIRWAKDEDREPDQLDDLLGAVADFRPQEDSDATALPTWLGDAAKAMRMKSNRQSIERHPAGGLIVRGKSDGRRISLDLEFGDMDDELSAIGKSVSLATHGKHVTTRTDTWAERCLPNTLANPLRTAAKYHDLGKADPRWQQVHMHGGQEDLAAIALAQDPPQLYAKSNEPPLRGAAFRRAREQAELPPGFRHEMLSLQLIETTGDGLPEDADLGDLILHLIAAHHGHARPFAPVVLDDDPPAVATGDLRLTVEQRTGLIPPHRLDSGVAERFWKLTRRHGWWGLAYLEAILRLADHAASAAEAVATSPSEQEVSR